MADAHVHVDSAPVWWSSRPCCPLPEATPAHPAFQREARQIRGRQAARIYVMEDGQHRSTTIRACAPFARMFGTANMRLVAVIEEDGGQAVHANAIVADARALASVFQPVEQAPAWAMIAAAADAAANKHGGAGWGTTVALALKLYEAVPTDVDASAAAAAMRRLPEYTAAFADKALVACAVSLQDLRVLASRRAEAFAHDIIRRVALVSDTRDRGSGDDGDGQPEVDVALAVAGLCRGAAAACALAGISFADVVATTIATLRAIRRERRRQMRVMHNDEDHGWPRSAPNATQHLRVVACFCNEARSALGAAQAACAHIIRRAALLEIDVLRHKHIVVDSSGADSTSTWRVLAVDGDLLIDVLDEMNAQTVHAVGSSTDDAAILPQSRDNRVAAAASSLACRLRALHVHGVVVSGAADEVATSALHAAGVSVVHGVGFAHAMDVAVTCCCEGLVSVDDIFDPEALTDEELLWYAGSSKPWRIVPLGFYESDDAPTRRVRDARTQTFEERRVILVQGVHDAPDEDDPCAEVVPSALVLFARSEMQAQVLRALMLRSIRRCISSLDWSREDAGSWRSFVAVPSAGIAEHVMAAAAVLAKKEAERRASHDALGIGAFARACQSLPILAACNRLGAHATGAPEVVAQAAKFSHVTAEIMRTPSSAKHALLDIARKAALLGWPDEASGEASSIAPLDPLEAKRDAVRAACSAVSGVLGAEVAMVSQATTM
ncbi:hypothetical protein NFJ02_14g17920 [Pycnococcus provasolii]